MAYSADLSAIQNNVLLQLAMDTVLKGNVVTYLLLTNNPKTFPGKTIEKTIVVDDYSTESGTTGYGDGMINFTYSVPQTKAKLSFDPGFHYQEVAVDQREIDVNSVDPRASVKMKVAAMEEASSTFANRMGGYLYGTSATGRTDGLRKIADDGTEATTYGGLTRSAYSLNNLDSYFQDLNATLSSSNDEYIITAISAARIGGDTPGLILTTDALYNIYEGLLTKTYNVESFRVTRGQMTRLGFIEEGRTGSVGVDTAFSSLYVHGAAMVADQLCTAAYMFFLNLKHLHWYSVPSAEPNARRITFGGNTQIEGMYKDMKSENVGMYFRDWMTSEAQYGQTGVLMLHGNVVTFDPRRHAKLLFS